MYKIQVSDSNNFSSIHTTFQISLEKANASKLIRETQTHNIIADSRIINYLIEYWDNFLDPRESIKHVVESDMRPNQIKYESISSFSIERQEFYNNLICGPITYSLYEKVLLLLQAANYCGLEVFSAELTIAIREKMILIQTTKEIKDTLKLNVSCTDDEMYQAEQNSEDQLWVMDFVKDIRNIVLVLEKTVL